MAESLTELATEIIDEGQCDPLEMIYVERHEHERWGRFFDWCGTADASFHMRYLLGDHCRFVCSNGEVDEWYEPPSGDAFAPLAFAYLPPPATWPALDPARLYAWLVDRLVAAKLT